MGYFITNLSFNFLVKEFLKSANIWQSYSKTVDCVILPIALHFCPRRCITCQINKIPCVLRTETAPNHCHVNRLINVSLLSTNIKLQYTNFWLTDWQTDAISDWPTADHVCHFAATFFAAAVVYSRSLDFLYGWCKNLFVSELKTAYFTRQIF